MECHALAVWFITLMLCSWLPVALALQSPPGWVKGEDISGEYEAGADRGTVVEGKPSGYVKNSVANPRGGCSYSQVFDATDYRGKRLRFSAAVKSEGVENWAGLWMRVDAPGKAIAVDNMQNRPIRGTQSWTRFSVVLDIDPKAMQIRFGMILYGKGAVWFNDLRFEEVGSDVPSTDMMRSTVPVDGKVDASAWIRSGSNASDYDMGNDSPVVFKGKSSIYIRSNKPDPQGNGSYIQMFDATNFRGKRMSISAYFKSENVESSAGLFMMVLGGDKPVPITMQNPVVRGTQMWTRASVVLDVDPKAIQIAFGLILAGPGAVWLDEVRFEEVSKEVPATGVSAQGISAGDIADVRGWQRQGTYPADYVTGTDPNVAFHGKYSGFIKSNQPNPRGFGTYMNIFEAADFRGRRIRFSAAVKCAGVEDRTTLWMRVDGPNKPLAFDNMEYRPIRGTQPWTEYSVTLDVDPQAVRIALGVILAGKGAVWFDDVRIEVVGSDVPVTDMMKLPSRPRNLGFEE